VRVHCVPGFTLTPALSRHGGSSTRRERGFCNGFNLAFSEHCESGSILTVGQAPQAGTALEPSLRNPIQSVRDTTADCVKCCGLFVLSISCEWEIKKWGAPVQRSVRARMSACGCEDPRTIRRTCVLGRERPAHNVCGVGRPAHNAQGDPRTTRIRSTILDHPPFVRERSTWYGDCRLRHPEDEERVHTSVAAPAP
jgi:hypothetical protein